MWRTFLLLILFSCAPTVADRTIEEESAAKMFILQKLFSTLKQLDSVKIDNVELKSEVKRLKEKVMANIEENLNYKENKAEAQYLNSKLKYIEIDKDSLFKKMDRIQHENYSLIKENENIKHDLRSEKTNVASLVKYKESIDKAIKEASVLNVSGLNIIGLGTSFFGRLATETNKASKIKKMRVSFDFPTNQFAEQEAKAVSVIVWSANKVDFIQKDTVVNYIGQECPIRLTLSGKEFKAGKHSVNILINGKMKLQKEFQVVN